jgi:hypothetical protein
MRRQSRGQLFPNLRGLACAASSITRSGERRVKIALRLSATAAPQDRPRAIGRRHQAALGGGRQLRPPARTDLGAHGWDERQQLG